MPVSHSHQLLCVSFSPSSRVSSPGWPDRRRSRSHAPRRRRCAACRPRSCRPSAVRAVAHPHHLRAARLVGAGRARDVVQVFRMRRIGDVDDRGAVVLGLAGQRIDRRRHVVGAAVMADIGDVAVALLVDGGLVGRARLQVVPADQLHVGGFRRRADLLFLRQRGPQTPKRQRPIHSPWWFMAFLPLLAAIIGLCRERASISGATLRRPQTLLAAWTRSNATVSTA